MTADSNVRYFVSVGFAILIVLLGFYALVIYEFALPELIQGFFVSVMTLAVQYVFGEQLAAGTARRVQRSYEAGSAASGGATTTVTTAENAETVTVSEEPVTTGGQG